MSLIEYWKRGPEQLWNLHAWRYSELDKFVCSPFELEFHFLVTGTTQPPKIPSNHHSVLLENFVPHLSLSWAKICQKKMHATASPAAPDHPVTASLIHCSTCTCERTVRQTIERKCVISLSPSVRLKGSWGMQGLKMSDTWGLSTVFC